MAATQDGNHRKNPVPRNRARRFLFLPLDIEPRLGLMAAIGAGLLLSAPLFV
jgi:hypothetical protein